MKMNRAELLRTIEYYKEVHKSKLKIGYCCYQNDNLQRYELEELGYNEGVYGWNWSLFYSEDTNTLYLSCYRNVPNYIYVLADAVVY